MRTGSPGHLKAFDYLGVYRYSLTFCTKDRREEFTDATVVDLVLAQISRAAAEQQFAVIAYCFMPDHLHLLVEGQSDASDCKQFIKLAKQYAAYYFSRSYGRVLWQRYGFEHTLRTEEDTLVVARYIVQNPLRTGLVERVEDYAFVGSLVCTLQELLEGIRSA